MQISSQIDQSCSIQLLRLILNELELKLTECFSLIFPKLSQPELQYASVTNIEEWDSLASVNIIAIIEEQFEIEIQPDDLETLTSYQQILRYIQEINTISD